MYDTSLSSRGGEFFRDRIEHGLVAIADPQANLFDPTPFELFQQIFPRLLIFPIADSKGQHFPFSALANAHNGQNGHFTALAVVDHGEISAIGEGVRIPLLKLARLPVAVFLL